MFLIIKISSKDNQTLYKFIKFLRQLKVLPIVIKQVSKLKSKKFLTVLRSPHVNKTAQEQFEFRHFKKQLLFDLLKPLTFFTILKKIRALSFPGIKLQIKSLLNPSIANQRKLLKLLDPDNVNLTQHYSTASSRKFIQLFDCYGEVCLKKIDLLNLDKSCILSSIG